MRKLILRTLVATVLLLSLFTVTAFAEDATVTGNQVNLRSGPGMNYSVINCLSRGTSVTVTDRSNSTWYSIVYNGQSGFMSSSYLSIQSGDSQPQQPASVRNFADLRELRAKALYDEDAAKELRLSHLNADVQKLYEEFLGEPNSHKAHELLHTTYVKRSIN